MIIRNILRVIGFIIRYPFLKFGKLIVRNRNIWIFGNSNGFYDNSKYFMDYLIKNETNIKPIWLSNNNKEKNRVKQLGYIVHSKYSFRGIYYSLISYVGVVTNGFGDLNRFTIGGQFLVYIGHSESIKKIYLDYDKDWNITGVSFFNIFNKVSFNLLKKNMSYYNLVIAGSFLSKKNILSAFCLSPNKISVTGLPRTDFIMNQIMNPNRVKKCEKKVVLYAPTWREMGWPKITDGQFDNDKWNNLLEETNTLLCIKIHPFTGDIIQEEWGINPSKNIKYLVGDKYQDINNLLPKTDILISDYSSVSLDYLLLEKPILFFTPDLEIYNEKRGLYFDIEDISNGLQCSTWKELYNALECCLSERDNGRPYIDNVKKLKNILHYRTDTDNCKRIYNQIISMLK